jgi:hypothetical protein
VGDLAGKIVHFKFGHTAGRTAGGQKFLPSVLVTHSERRKQAKTRNDNAPHV